MVFILQLIPHPTFSRAPHHIASDPSGSADLFVSVSITLSEALLGFSRIILRHLDGRRIHMSRQASTSNGPSSSSSKTKGKSGPNVGQGLPVQHGDVVCIRGEGMPIYDSSQKREASADMKKGDLYVQFKVEMPSAEWLSQTDPKVRFSCPQDIINLVSAAMSLCTPTLWRCAQSCH